MNRRGVRSRPLSYAERLAEWRSRQTKTQVSTVNNFVPKKKRKFASKSQAKLTAILEQILGLTAESEKGFTWLRSPKGAPLRIDIYFKTLGLAVEYHGKQHYEFPNAFHKTAEDFRYAAQCDAWKKELLKRKGIAVIEFSYKEPLTVTAVRRKLGALNLNRS